jgi:hypothetical protein
VFGSGSRHAKKPLQGESIPTERAKQELVELVVLEQIRGGLGDLMRCPPR